MSAELSTNLNSGFPAPSGFVLWSCDVDRDKMLLKLLCVFTILHGRVIPQVLAGLRSYYLIVNQPGTKALQCLGKYRIT